MPDWGARLRERLAADGVMPSAHAEALDEIAEHLNDLYRAAIADGTAPEAAAAMVEAELARMGPLAVAVAERAKRRRPHTADWTTGLVSDFRNAIRAIRLERGFSTVVILTLAIGIGACTAVFSIVNALLFGSLPFPKPQELVVAWETDGDNRERVNIVAYPVYEDWQRETRSFASMGIWEYRTFNVASDQEPEQVQGIRATSSLFTVLGVPPALGRVFTPEEDAPGHRVAVIGDGIWRTHLGGRASVIGSSIQLNGEAFEVIGVMPTGFDFPWRRHAIWIPFSLVEQDTQRGSHSFRVAARLRTGVTFGQARADIEQVGRALRQRYDENPQEDTYGPPIRESFCADLSRGAEGLPGVQRIGAISHLPLSGANAGRGLTIEGYTPDADGSVGGSYRLVCPGYFETLGIAVTEGRDFNHRDVTNGARVMIINRAMADAYWKHGDSPIGRRLKLGGPQSDNPWMTVVGITGNVRHFGLDSDARREIFLPYSQAAWPVMTVVAKTVGDPMAWQSALREVVKRVDPFLPIARVDSMENVVGSSLNWRKTPMRLLSVFAIVGLLLASIGVYGVLAYYVSQRTREIGVRAALGATRAQLAGLVVRQSLWPLAAGVVIGVGGSLATGRLLQEFLFEVRPGDPQVIATIVVLLVGVGLLAGWLPARRAAAIDPMVALRDE